MKRKILIADDVKSTRMVLRRILEQLSQDWLIDEAATGEEALDSYFSNEPEIVLLDVQLPQIDGWDVLRCIREVDKRVLVIMVTGSEYPEDVQKALDLEATGFVCKPFDLEEIGDALGLSTSLIAV